MGTSCFLVTAGEVSASIERHRGNPRPVSLSRAALEVLAIVAYRQGIARGGIEHIRGSSSDSALDTLLQRGLVVHNEHHLLVTTRAFLDLAGLRDLADLPQQMSDDVDTSSTAEMRWRSWSSRGMFPWVGRSPWFSFLSMGLSQGLKSTALTEVLQLWTSKTCCKPASALG
jgi:hypothetical protein